MDIGASRVKALTEKFLVFWRDGRLREVAHEGSAVIN